MEELRRSGADVTVLAADVSRREDVARCLAGIGERLPPGVAIANAATSVEYLTGHANLNLHGVSSPAFVGGRTAEREASMFEALGRLPGSERPPYLLLTRSARPAWKAERPMTGNARDPLPA